MMTNMPSSSSPLSSPTTTMLTIKTTLLQEKRRFQIPLATPSDDNNNQIDNNNNNNNTMYDMIRKKIVQLYQLNPDYDTFLIQYKDDDDDDIIVTSDDDLHVAIRCINRTLTKKLSSLDNQMMGSSGDMVLHLSVAKTLNHHSQSAVDGSSVGIGAIVDRIVEDQSSSSSSHGVNVIAAATADGNGDRNNHNDDVNKRGNRSSSNLLGRISRILKDKNRRRRHRHRGGSSSNNDNNDDENDNNTDHVVNEEGLDDNDDDGDDVDDDVDDADLDDLGADSGTSFDEEESEHNTRSISNVLTAHTSTEYLDHEITSTSFYFPHALQQHHQQQHRQNNSDVVVSSKLAPKENQQPTTTGRSSPVPMATLHPSNYQGIIPPTSPSSTPPPLVPSQYYISMYQQQSNGGSNMVYPQQGYYHVPYGNLVGAASHVDSPLPSHPHHPYFTHPQAYHLGATGNTTANNRSYSPSAQFMQQQNAALGLVSASSGDMGVGSHRIPFLHELPPVPSLAQTMALYEEPIPLKLQLKLLKLEFQFKRQLLMNEYKQQFLQLKRDNAKPNSRLDKKLQVQMTNIRLTAQKQRLLITHQQEKVLNSFEKLRLKRKNVAVDDVDLSSRLMWPNNLEKVYVHGNNMFAFNPLKKYAKKDRDFANKIVIDLCSAFFGEMQNLSLVHVVFDNTGRVVETVDPNHANRSFTVSSAASQQKDADDVIIDFAMYSRKNTGVGMPESSVFVTCDRDLRQVLKQFGCKCIHPQRFLEFIYIILDGHDRTFDDWLTQDFIH